MNNVLYTIIMVILWIVNLFNGTGLGQAYQTTERARVIIYIFFAIIVILNYKKGRHYVKKQDLIILGSMSLLFVFDSYMQGYGMMGVNYFTVFILVYILSKMEAKETAIKLTGLLYLIMGIAVIYIYNYGALFSGWNPNTIGMIALYSYLIFLIPFYSSKNTMKSKIILIAITILYMVLIEGTDSRSSTIFALIAILFVLSIMPKSILMKKYFGVLLIPLAIAVIVVWISKTNYMMGLNAWSIEKFQKPIFNGRDALWEEGFQLMSENFLFGSGSFNGRNWHNCLITILTAYGFLGGLLWILSLRNILAKGSIWIKDIIVPGCIISFLIMYLQQTVELGLVAESPNLLPYIVLGMMLGRVNFLKKRKYVKEMEE